ncbi:GerA spore germination protein [Corchorus capsularis]|uniref:GerA spore germination protein n=1 Tax=Corchorus capsularis TaxID=210143 RepID=A0A1R3HSP6_COCAP|nr:GerA spore germination protein [Corchorus capsularis]
MTLKEPLLPLSSSDVVQGDDSGEEARRSDSSSNSDSHTTTKNLKSDSSSRRRRTSTLILSTIFEFLVPSCFLGFCVLGIISTKLSDRPKSNIDNVDECVALVAAVTVALAIVAATLSTVLLFIVTAILALASWALLLPIWKMPIRLLLFTAFYVGLFTFGSASSKVDNAIKQDQPLNELNKKALGHYLGLFTANLFALIYVGIAMISRWLWCSDGGEDEGEERRRYHFQLPAWSTTPFHIFAVCCIFNCFGVFMEYIRFQIMD